MTKLANVIIPVSEAKLQERQVTVQVLTIGTKQITQALYKQLTEVNIRDEDGLINPFTGKVQGTIWGWVNLHDNCMFDKKDHLHVVWESNGELKKSEVHLPWTKTSSSYGSIHMTSYCTELANKGKIDELNQLRANWLISWQTCKNAGQLFIAVSGVWK
jgi:hypothetical protein